VPHAQGSDAAQREEREEIGAERGEETGNAETTRCNPGATRIANGKSTRNRLQAGHLRCQLWSPFNSFCCASPANKKNDMAAFGWLEM